MAVNIGKWEQVTKQHPTPVARPELYFERHLPNGQGIAHVHCIDKDQLWTWWTKGFDTRDWNIDVGHTLNPLKALILADLSLCKHWGYNLGLTDYFEVISGIVRANQEWNKRL